MLGSTGGVPQFLSNSSGYTRSSQGKWNGERIELIIRVAPLCNSGRVPITASVPLPSYATFIHSLHRAFVNTRCRYALGPIVITVED